MTETIKFGVDSDGVATLAFNVPDQSMNILTEQTVRELDELVDRVIADEKIIGAVITSARDNAFLAGADLKLIQRLADESKTRPAEEIFDAAFMLNRIFRKMETGGHTAKELAKGAETKPFVSAVNGLAMGGGLEIQLACHHRFVADDPAIKMGLPEVQVGILPGAGGTQRLPRLIGIAEALKLMTTGKAVDPAKAKQLGIIHDVVPRAELITQAKAWIRAHPSVSQPWDKKGFKFPGGGGAMNPNAVQTFMVANAMAQEQTQHNYPAVQRILSCVYEGSIVPIDVGIRIESKYFCKCIMEPQALNMIRTLFVNKQKAERGEARPRDVERMPVKKLGVLGAGMMGAGIAYVSAKAGIEVVLIDRELEYAEKGKSYSEKLVHKGMERGKVTKEEAEALLSRITPSTDYDDLKDVDFVIEAVFEDTKIKKEVIEKTEAVIGADRIFASNTSTLPISGLAEFSRHPDQFVGVHFFSPVDKMPLVEIIKGKQTGDRAIAQALDFVAQIKKTPIVVNDARGFYANRIVMPYLSEAMGMVGEGIRPALIENGAKMLGMPVGPLALVDETSIELGYRIMSEAKKAEGAAYVEQPGDQVLTKMYEIGRLGRKAGKGFYDYPDGGKKHLWPGLAEEFPPADLQPGVDEVKSRLLYRQAIEVVRCLEAGILNDAMSADIGAIFGWGFAPWTGGPLSYIDTIGLVDFVAEADNLAAQHGERFAPPQMLRDMASRGETFYKAAAAA